MYNSLDEAMAARIDLINRIQSIDTQLSERMAEVSNRVEDSKFKEYREWKARAVRAKLGLTSRLQQTKLWISAEHSRQSAEKQVVKSDARLLLQRAVKLLEELVSDGIDLDEDEKCVVDDIYAFIERG